MQSFFSEDYFFSFHSDPLSEVISHTCSQSDDIKDTNYTLYFDMQQPEDQKQAQIVPFLDDDFQERVKTTSESKRNSGTKRKYIRKGQPLEYRSGKWTLTEKNLYNQFITRYTSADPAWSIKVPRKKRTKFFVCMSDYIQSRSPKQCRSYDQKQSERKQSGSTFAESSPETCYVPEKYPHDTSIKTIYRNISDFSPVSPYGMNECQSSIAPSNCSPFDTRSSDPRVDSYLNFNVQANNCAIVKSRMESSSITNMEKLLICDEKVKESQEPMLYSEMMVKMMRRKMLNAVERLPSDTF